jgi:5-methyltetrahydrofolate--homocysteine methyltransferase
MAHVAREMERAGLTLPLLIGGATTSQAHTAVKIAPAYSHAVVHVLDASRAVPFVSQLLNPDQRPKLERQIRDDYSRIRAHHADRRQKLLTLAAARANAPKLGFDNLPRPEFIGVRTVESGPLDEIAKFIDWSPFFHTWELRGRYPAILKHERHGETATRLFAEAQELLGRIISDKLLSARAVYGLFPANRNGDDVELYADESRSRVLASFHFLRQQVDKGDGTPNWCLADFVAPRQSPVLADHLGAFAVTSGVGLDELAAKFKADHDDYSAIMAAALADRLAEAFAEYLHLRVRREWGYGRAESLTLDQLVDEQYQGIRPAAGYPACPDHTEKTLLWRVLDAEKNTGMKLTESGAMWPASSVSGLYFAHPESKYFAVGKLGRDQVEDLARRKGMTLPEMERWLAPYLNYDPV